MTEHDKISKEFNNLLNEKEAFNAAAATAERERRREEQILSGHRSAAQQVSDQLRVAQSESGEVARKLQNLRESKVRLARQIEADRMEIVKVTNELKGKESDDKKQKWNFVKEMEGINDELYDLLAREEEEKTMRLIDVDTVQWLIETKLASMMNQEGMDEHYAEAENEKWREIQSKIEEARSGLVEAKQTIEMEMRERNELEKTLGTLREKFAVVRPNIGQTEIDALEIKWEETIVLDNEYNDQSNDDMVVDEGMPSKQSEMTGPAPVHMDIFYDGQ